MRLPASRDRVRRTWFLVAEVMVEAGVLAGLSWEVAETLAFQTLLGSSRLLVDGSIGPAAPRGCGDLSRRDYRRWPARA